MEQTFVFVVCGAKEHLDTLNFSLRALKRFSHFPILVVTDLKRNETGIDHPSDQIIDIRVTEEYNHHQASIYLKTGLHRFLTMENKLYCYLDTDVVALNTDVSKVFDHYTSPITFATDHFPMNQFSPYATHCGCVVMTRELQDLIDQYTLKFKHLAINKKSIEEIISKWNLYKQRFPLEHAINEWFDKLLKNNSDLRKKSARLIKLTSPDLPFYKLAFNYLFRVLPHYRRTFGIKQWKDLQGNILLDEGLDYHQFMNERGFFFDAAAGTWLDSKGNSAEKITTTFEDFCGQQSLVYNSNDHSWYKLDGTFFFPNITKLIELNSHYRYDQVNDTWYDQLNNCVFVTECDHLKGTIKKDFEVDVKHADWQHWNGGVFLFDKESIPFLDAWHKLTLEAFSLPNWKTRDQGTLITTVWKYGLQDHPTLPVRFNFIADYYNPEMAYLGNFTFQLSTKESVVVPALIHIFHHWGDENWAVWRDVHQHISQS